MDGLIVLVFLAVLIEGAVEYLVAEPWKKAGLPGIYLRYIALAAGVGLAFVFEADLPALLGISVAPVAAHAVTGVVVSRGANYLSDFIGRVNGS